MYMRDGVWHAGARVCSAFGDVYWMTEWMRA